MKDKRRTIKAAELRVATKMLNEGASWYAIAKRLGKASSDGIRRRLDAKYHKRRNRYQAKWQLENRAG